MSNAYMRNNIMCAMCMCAIISYVQSYFRIFIFFVCAIIHVSNWDIGNWEYWQKKLSAKCAQTKQLGIGNVDK